MNVPEGAKTVESEAKDLKQALAGAAAELGLHPSQVDHKLDLSHFRSSIGTSVSRTTVKIIAWGTDREVSEEPVKAAKPKRERSDDRKERSSRDGDGDGEERRSRSKDRDGGRRGGRGRGRDRDRDREDRGGRGGRGGDSRKLRGPEEGTTDASEFAAAWFVTLLSQMDVKGEVSGTGAEGRVHLTVTAEGAGRIIGKRGSTLGAIRHLLGLALEKKFGELVLDVDVDDPRPAGEEDGGDGEERRGRGRGRGRRNRSSRGGSDRGGDDKARYEEDQLRALARLAAEKAVDSGQTITIKLELNSYDRRIVHMEVAEIDNVVSRSEEREDGSKVIQVAPE